MVIPISSVEEGRRTTSAPACLDIFSNMEKATKSSEVAKEVNNANLRKRQHEEAPTDGSKKTGAASNQTSLDTLMDNSSNSRGSGTAPAFSFGTDPASPAFSFGTARDNPAFSFGADRANPAFDSGFFGAC